MVKDISGKKFNRLTAIRFEQRRDGKKLRTYWFCRCECGVEKFILRDSLVSSGTKSCGCLDLEVLIKRNTVHGMRYKPEYQTWLRIRQRCLNKRSQDWKWYGGRGITICKRWDKFENFFKDMGENKLGLSIDRVDNEKGYSPDNCRWATQIEQQNNKSTSRRVTINGETKTLTEWIIKLKLNRHTIISRITDGWTHEKALTTPVRPKCG